jgi:hypothetical protein
MTFFELKNIDQEDIEDLLIKIEDSFNIKFNENELVNIQTFGEFCDVIKNKIKLKNSNDCTTQQAFYKLRSVLIKILIIDKANLTSDTLLTELIPKKSRKEKVKLIEQHLGFKLYCLRPPHLITNLLILLLLISLFGLFFSWQGLIGIGISFSGFWLASVMANEFNQKTIGDLVNKMARENYVKSRRNSNTYNKREIEKVLIELFSNDLNVDKSILTSEARFS